MWESELREKLKAYDHQLLIEVNRDEVQFVISPGIIKGKVDLKTIIKERKGILYATIKHVDSYEADLDFLKAWMEDTTCDFDILDGIESKNEGEEPPNEVIEFLLEAIGRIAKQKKSAVICIEGIVQENILKKMEYKKKVEHEAYIRNIIPMESYLTYVRITDGEKVRLMHDISSLVGEEMACFRESDPTFSYTASSNYWRYYYDGYDGKITLDYEQNQFVLKEEKRGHTITIKKTEEVKAAFQEIMEKTHQYMRLRNVTNPPMKYFYSMFSGFQKEDAKRMHELLLQEMNYKEIERYAAENMNKDNPRMRFRDIVFIQFAHIKLALHRKDYGQTEKIEKMKENETEKEYAYREYEKKLKEELENAF